MKKFDNILSYIYSIVDVLCIFIPLIATSFVISASYFLFGAEVCIAVCLGVMIYWVIRMARIINKNVDDDDYIKIDL